MKNINCSNCGQEISKKAPTCPKCGHPNRISNHLSGGQTLLGLAVAIGAIWWMADRDYGSEASGKSAAISRLQLTDVSWGKGGFDTAMLLSATIRNTGKSDVKDIEIECKHTSNSGTKIDSNSRVVYELVPVGESIKLSDFNMGFIHSQATKTNCRVVDAVVL